MAEVAGDHRIGYAVAQGPLLVHVTVLLELVDEQNHLHLMDGDVEEVRLVGGDGLAKVVGDDGLGVLAGADDDVTKVGDPMLQGVSVISNHRWP